LPEGDTIHRSAARLRRVLVGHDVVRVEAPRAHGRPPPPGTRIDAVDAVGKHLLIRFADGVTLRTHMRMTGSWHLYAAGERWRKPAGMARAVVEVDGWVAVCFSAPVVELERRPEESIAHLGPDLTRPGADIDAAVARMDALADPADEIGAVLLDQRVACGVGNLWKSETLFACGVDPFTTVAGLDGDARRHLLSTAAAFLQQSVLSSRAAPAVYRRAGQPCRRCGTPIRSRRQGAQARTTYWCPACQL
jgi:endonuclease-8